MKFIKDIKRGNKMKYFSYLLLFIVMGFTLHAQTFPEPVSYVSDYANVIDVSSNSIMLNFLYHYEQKTSIEIAVVTVGDLQGEVLESYATGLFNKWGIGKKGIDDGVLILLSLDDNDRGIRIEVGYGLEEFLTDYQCSNIINEVMPLLKSGDYSKALHDASQGVVSAIGFQSKEVREQYLANLEKERKESTERLLYIFLILIGITCITVIFYIIYRIFKRMKELKEERKEFRNHLLTTLGNLDTSFIQSIKYAKQLEDESFKGASDIHRKLVKLHTRINREFPDALSKAKKDIEVKKISADLDMVVLSYNKDVGELSYNKDVDTKLRGKLEARIETIEREMRRAIPNAKASIDRINADNPPSIWRGFDYTKMETKVNMYIDTANRLAKDSIKQLDRGEFIMADETSKIALSSVHDAYTMVQSVFDVEKHINMGKQTYNRYISGIPATIELAEKSVGVNNVKASTRDMVTMSKERYKELQNEISKNKNADWIVIGALILAIVNSCNDAITKSSSDIREYKRKIEEESRRKRYQEEESRRRRSSSSSGGGSSFGGFGGGRSGGGGASGRF